MAFRRGFPAMSNGDPNVRFEDACAAVALFARERNWSQYHDPKNLSMLLGSEAGELLAEFRWISNAESDDHAAEPQIYERVKDEIADVAISLILLCQRIDVDMAAAVMAKLQKNAENYPVTDAYASPHRSRNE